MTRYSDDETYKPGAFSALFKGNTMAKTVTALLKDIAAIKNSDELNENQKAHVLSGLRAELDKATGQAGLALTEGVPSASQAPSSQGKAAKAS